MVFSLSVHAADSEIFSNAELKALKPVTAPAVRFPPPKSETTIAVDYQDKITLVHFWATWCVACRKEFPQLKNLQRDYAGRNLQIIAIAADSHDATYQYKLDHNLSMPVLVDQYGKALKEFRVKALPSSFLIDSHGQLRYQATGRVDWSHAVVKDILTSLMTK